MIQIWHIEILFLRTVIVIKLLLNSNAIYAIIYKYRVLPIVNSETFFHNIPSAEPASHLGRLRAAERPCPCQMPLCPTSPASSLHHVTVFIWSLYLAELFSCAADVVVVGCWVSIYSYSWDVSIDRENFCIISRKRVNICAIIVEYFLFLTLYLCLVYTKLAMNTYPWFSIVWYLTNYKINIIYIFARFKWLHVLKPHACIKICWCRIHI